MAKQFPKTLFVKIERADDADYFVADDDSYGLAEMGETIKIATYQFVDVSDAKVMVEFTKPKRRR